MLFSSLALASGLALVPPPAPDVRESSTRAAEFLVTGALTACSPPAEGFRVCELEVHTLHHGDLPAGIELRVPADDMPVTCRTGAFFLSRSEGGAFELTDAGFGAIFEQDGWVAPTTTSSGKPLSWSELQADMTKTFGPGRTLPRAPHPCHPMRTDDPSL